MRGAIEPKKFKEVIIESRLTMLKELIEFFPFYLKQDSFQNSVEEFAKESEIPDPRSIEELKEKDELLQELGNRIDKIFNKLKGKHNE